MLCRSPGRKQVLFLYLACQLLMILPGTVTTLPSCWDFYPISTPSGWSWSSSRIEASPSPLVTASEAGLTSDPQGSVLASLLFDICLYNLPSIVSIKYAYADDRALLHFSADWKALEETLSQDMATLPAQSQDLEAETQPRKDSYGGFLLTQSRGQMRA